jgi:hypothetical protein
MFSSASLIIVIDFGSNLYEKKERSAYADLSFVYGIHYKRFDSC